MARTKASRNVPPFSLRSGAATPYPFLRGLKNTGVGKFFQKAVNTSPIGLGINALTGNTSAPTFGNIGEKLLGGGSDNVDTSTKIDELHAAIVGGEGEGAAIEGVDVDPAVKEQARREKEQLSQNV
tara:strand:+ start:1092 stop:1469 length:378 start_codon:yes stop_codon:yes gene_type:complete